jgi:glycogen operon protein
MHDLVSYNEKHNEANGEDNRDGESFNRSWNCGVEGPTDDLDIIALREQQKRNFFATLLLSQGVPMIVAGDERGRTQGGNNNAYCQDNEISWIDWSDRPESEFLCEFVAMLSELRREHPVFRRRRFFIGRPLRGSGGLDDLVWLQPDGQQMTDEDWEAGFAKTLGVFLNGQGIPDPDPRGQRVTDDSFLLFFNAHFEAVDATVPPQEYGESWMVQVDTHAPLADTAQERTYKPGEAVEVEARSLIVLRRVF